MFLDLPHACVLLLVAWLGQGVDATSESHRVLRAATKRSDLYKRDMRITKRFEAGLDYIEGMFKSTLYASGANRPSVENGWGGASTFASQVKVGSQKPIMNLEVVEHFLQDVKCSEGKMALSFVDKVAARDAYHSCHNEHGGLVITSHESCNEEGERAVYR